MKNFFQRQKTSNYKNVFLPLFSAYFNISNIESIKKKKILELYKPEFAVDFLAYRFDLLNEWMKQNESYTKEYIVMLDQIIDKLWLTNELNSFERQYIKNLQAIVFAKNRNLKQLIVDFNVNKDEYVFYRYQLNNLEQIDSKKTKLLIDNLEIYISTQRIILTKDLDVISIYYDEIDLIKFNRQKLYFLLKSGSQCYIQSENNIEIFESLKRIMNYINIKLIKDE